MRRGPGLRARSFLRPAWLPARSRLLLPAVLLSSALLPGCLFVGGSGSFGAPLDAGLAAQITPGHTTKAQVLALLGPPSEFKRPEVRSVLVDDQLRVAGVLAAARRAENVFTWQHDAVRARGTWLLLFAGFRSEARQDLLVVWFDEHDVVSTVGYRPAETAR